MAYGAGGGPPEPRAARPVQPDPRTHQRGARVRGRRAWPRRGAVTMSTGDVFLFLSAFLASAVEMVEALTIVLAVGVTRGWRSALLGAGAALAALAVLVGALGPAVSSVPIDDLRVLVGGLLLIFGLQWLRKAILRTSGYMVLHDEDAAYTREREEASRAGADVRRGVDWYSFTLSFKGVFLEGLEVAFIVVT